MTRTRTQCAGVGFLLGAMLVCATHARAEQGSPSAEAIIEQSAKFAQSVKTLYGDILSTFTARRGPMVARTQVWGELPDKVVTHNASSGGTTIIYQLGTQQTTFFQTKNQYVISNGASTAGASGVQDFLSVGLGTNGPLSGAVGGRQLTFIGKETVAGIPTNHLRVVLSNGTSADLFIADGAQPLPVYVRMTQGQPPTSSEMSYRWIVDKPVPPGIFQFTPPPGATQLNITLPAVGK